IVIGWHGRARRIDVEASCSRCSLPSLHARLPIPRRRKHRLDGLLYRAELAKCGEVVPIAIHALARIDEHAVQLLAALEKGFGVISDSRAHAVVVLELPYEVRLVRICSYRSVAELGKEIDGRAG